MDHVLLTDGVTLVSPGVTLAGGGGRSAFGGEVSVVRTPSLPHTADFPAPIFWFGGYVDGVYDTVSTRARFSIGPEFGIGPVGVDGGLVVQTSTRPLGATIRILYGIGFVMGYTRWVYVDDPFSSSRIFEAGVLLKLPVFNVDPPRRSRRGKAPP
ncbi:MAG: hypothetical protein U0169_21830 [Polyangiaceae bacterium]